MCSRRFFPKISVPPVLVLVIKEKVFFSFPVLLMFKRNNINKREKHFTGSGLVIFFWGRGFSFFLGFGKMKIKKYVCFNGSVGPHVNFRNNICFLLWRLFFASVKSLR